MKKIVTAAIIAAATVTAGAAFAADTDTVTTAITATVQNEVHVSGITTAWDLGTVTADALQATGGITQTDSNVQMWTNADGATGLDVQVQSAKSAPAGTGIDALPQGQAVIAVGTPDGNNADAMVPVTMTCTPCNLTNNTTVATPIQFSAAGNTATGAGSNANETVTSDTGGTRQVQIRNATGAEYTTQAACTTGTGTAASCTFQAGPTTGYEAEGGTYTGTLTQLYSDATA